MKESKNMIHKKKIQNKAKKKKKKKDADTWPRSKHFKIYNKLKKFNFRRPSQICHLYDFTKFAD